MVIFYTIAVFLAAALLFGVQPMVAKALLPDFGGGSGVWTTCMLFFQTALIGGYLYAHLLLTRVPRRAQFFVHGGLLGLALVAGLLFSEPVPPPGASSFPVPWLLGQLFLIAGLPFFAISSAGPLLQGWFARTGHARAHDPYFLYAASNAGSFVGLLAYPFVVEPALGLDRQRAVWLGLFAVFGVLAMGCLRRTRTGRLEPGPSAGDSGDAPVDWRRRLWWMFLAFVPSSTLLGVTTHITTDVASFPLLWVIPLSVYLLTMILAFSGRAAYLQTAMARPMVLSIIAALVLLVAWVGAEQIPPMWANLGVQLAVLLTVGLYGHARLAVDRPHASRLTEYFLVISVGGALGGIFNGLVAPLVFDSDYEYHIALVCALLMLPGRARAPEMNPARFWLRRLRIPAISLAAYAFAVLTAPWVLDAVEWAMGGEKADTASVGEMAGTVALLVWLVPPGLLVYMGWRDRIASAGALLFPLCGVVIASGFNPSLVLRTRTFYGIHVVERFGLVDDDRGLFTHRLIHGTTMHGIQLLGDPEEERIPRSYYHPDGPCGAMKRVLAEMRSGPARLGVIGLGTGAMATMGRAGDTLVFMEIDPVPARIASDTRYFTYLANAEAACEIRLGDGRLLLERSAAAGEPPFDALFIDAFSSDAIPTHLLTEEAVGLYFERLAPDGFVAMHVSNRHLDLRPLLSAIADRVPAYDLVYADEVKPEVEARVFSSSSVWVVLTRDPDTGRRLLHAGFVDEPADVKIRPWTDQYSNLLSVIERR